MKYLLLCLLTVAYATSHACECAREVYDKQKIYSTHYIYKVCRTPEEAHKSDRIDWNSWWKGYLQAHSDIANLLYLKNKDCQ